MKQIRFKQLILVIFSLNLTACGTIASLADGDYTVYGGVRKDFSVLQEGGVFSILAAVDLPLSFVLDTLMLPVTLGH